MFFSFNILQINVTNSESLCFHPKGSRGSQHMKLLLKWGFSAQTEEKQTSPLTAAVPEELTKIISQTVKLDTSNMSFSCAYLVYWALGWPSVFGIFFRQLLQNVAIKTSMMHQESHHSITFKISFY